MSLSSTPYQVDNGHDSLHGSHSDKMPTLNNNFVADTRGKYHQNTASLVQFIKKIGRVNVFLLLYKWPRLMTPKRVDQLQLYQQVFGKTWWSHVISQVNWWRHDRNSAHLRNRRNISEELVDKIMNENYTSLWNVSAEIPTTFVCLLYTSDAADE